MNSNCQETWVLLSHNLWSLFRCWLKPPFYFCCRCAEVNKRDRQTDEKFILHDLQKAENRMSVAVYSKKNRILICFNNSGGSASWRLKFLKGGGGWLDFRDLRVLVSTFVCRMMVLSVATLQNIMHVCSKFCWFMNKPASPHTLIPSISYFENSTRRGHSDQPLQSRIINSSYMYENPSS